MYCTSWALVWPFDDVLRGGPGLCGLNRFRRRRLIVTSERIARLSVSPSVRLWTRFLQDPDFSISRYPLFWLGFYLLYGY
jgi:hypothetical protein